MERLNPFIGLAGRILISLIFVLSGLNKITGYAGTQAYMDSMGVPGMLLPLAILLEVGGGLAVIVGWRTRTMALLLAGFTLFTAVVFHADFGNKMQLIMFLKNLAMVGGLVCLVKYGAGELSLDHRRRSGTPEGAAP